MLHLLLDKEQAFEIFRNEFVPEFCDKVEDYKDLNAFFQLIVHRLLVGVQE